MTITKFEVYKDREEIAFPKGAQIFLVKTQEILDEYSSGDTDARLVASYGTEAEARAKFEALKRTCSTSVESGNVNRLIEADVLILARVDYEVDEDGEETWDQSEELDAYAEPFCKVYDIEGSAAALYDGGWRANDRDQIKAEYELDDDDADALAEQLARIKSGEDF